MKDSMKIDKYLLIPNATAFMASFCIMVLELTAARLIARHLGVSLYTWTSVIGVVLGGIALGNYMGGKIADRFQPQKALSTLFILASLACVTVPILNQLMGNWFILFRLSWPMRITFHVALIFLLPSTLLGMIGPVVAKLALDKGLKTGHTVGSVYAWGAIGSIAGTFFTGFFLIAFLGTIKVIWTLAVVLAIMGMLYRRRSFLPYLWLGIVTILVFVSFSSQSWAFIAATRLALREPHKENVIYAKDSQYSYITVAIDELNPKIYDFNLDTLTQTQMNIDEPTNLSYAYDYYQIFDDIIKNFKPEKEELSFLNLGGGGYIFPRYIEKTWPKSHIEVVEIDPEVTRAAQRVFGLSEESGIIIHHMDARNYIEDLARAKQTGGEVAAFDFIFLDVFAGGVAVPYQLTTEEFNQKIAKLLTANGLYIINLVDSQTSPRFLKSMTETLENTFSHIYVILTDKRKTQKKYSYGTYVLLASQKELDKEIFDSSEFRGRRLSKAELKSYIGNLKGVMLTDDFAPTDYLLKEVFSRKGEYGLCVKMMDIGMGLLQEKKVDEAMVQFERVLRVDPDFVGAHVNIGSFKIWQGQYGRAVEHFQKALNIDPEAQSAIIGLGNVFKRQGRLNEAIEMYRKELEIDPKISYMYLGIGNILIEQGKLGEAIENYNKALEIEPGLQSARKNLGIAVKQLSQIDEAEE
ncbi:fused MFS/spermidine synthase [Candidatus Omnitrophota bacterium]